MAQKNLINLCFRPSFDAGHNFVVGGIKLSIKDKGCTILRYIGFGKRSSFYKTTEFTYLCSSPPRIYERTCICRKMIPYLTYFIIVEGLDEMPFFDYPFFERSNERRDFVLLL